MGKRGRRAKPWNVARRRNALLAADVKIAEQDIGLSAIRDATDEALKQMAERVKDRAKQTSAFADHTGNLRRSIRVLEHPHALGYIVRAGGTGESGHAHLVEFGHAQVTKDGRIVGHVPPHPFLRPALEEEVAAQGWVYNPRSGGFISSG